MSWWEAAKVWRRMGSALETDLGARLNHATGDVINKAAGVFMTPTLTEDIPWTPVDKPPSEATVSLVTTAGFHLADDQPFDVDAAEGDPSFREIPASTSPDELRITHTHYPHRYVKQDPNVLLPLDRLRELDEAGVFRLAPTLFSFGFGGTLTDAYVDPPEGTAHQVARRMAEDGVDWALLVPA